MTEHDGHNPWRANGDRRERPTPAGDPPPEPPPRERPTPAGDPPPEPPPRERPTPADGLEAINGEPIPPLTVEESEWMKGIAAWYIARCQEVGVKPPGDILRCIAACANEVVSYNEALAEQARRDGAGEPDKPVMQ